MAHFIASPLAQCPEDISLHDLAGQAALRRTHHDHRLAIVAGTKAKLAEHLGAFLAGKPFEEDAIGRIIPAVKPRLAFVCSGQGPQWWAMGRQLFRHEAVFRDMIERCDVLIRRLGSWSLVDELKADESRSRMGVTAIAQPALFALQVGLAELLASWGVKPEAVVGHSVGEVAAAYLAGVFRLPEAVRIIYERGRCMELASARGRMLAAAVTPDEARALHAPFGSRVSLAAINSPASATLSGEAGPLEEIAALLEARQVFCRFLQVHYAFHSAQMDPIRDELIESLRDIRPARAKLPFFSTVLGRCLEGPELGADYWWQNVRQTVRFAEAVNHLIEQGCDTVLELSPHPVLTSAVTECFQLHGKKVSALFSLKRQEGERATLLSSLGRLFTAGYPVDWAGIFPGPRKFVELPLYPWQRQRCWFESEESRLNRLSDLSHPLLGRTDGGPKPTWDVRLDLRLFPYLADHRVQQAAIVPAAAYLEMAGAVAREVLGQAACQIEDVQLIQPCYLLPEKPLRVGTSYDPESSVVQIHARDVQGEQDWTLHFRALIRPLADSEPVQFGTKGLRETGRPFSQEECYAFLHKLGLDYGPHFQRIEQCWQGEGESLGIVHLPDSMNSGDDYYFHPALLDACFQVSVSANKDFPDEPGDLYLPVQVEQVRFFQRPGRSLWPHARVREKTDCWFVADIDIADDADSLVAQIRGLRSQRVAGNRATSRDGLLYAYQWQLANEPIVEGTNGQRRSWLVFADRGGVGKQLVERLLARGDSCTLVYPNEETSEVLKTSEVWQGLIHLWNLDAPAGEKLATSDLETAQEPGLLSVLHLAQAWDKVYPDRTVPLFLVTRGAQAVTSEFEPTAVAQSPVIGLGRVIISEYPRFRCKLVDLDPAASDLSSLVDELIRNDDEDEIAFRGPDRFVHRFRPLPMGQDPNPAVPDMAGSESCSTETSNVPYRAEISSIGTLESLTFHNMVRQAPGTREVEIEVRAAGLNFSDVLKTLGMYPGLADGPVPLGAECSGIITTIGDGVNGFKIGDEVLGVAPFAFASHVCARAELVAIKPQGLSFEEAATVPIAFLTASYAMSYLGRLLSGERVLIHSASGGVGLAAIQVARRAGAEVFATAGTAQKRDFLLSLGIEQVMDSRSLAFADQILERTGGRGVDMILNSLAGDAISRGLAALADHGRFLEIGKRDIHQNTRIGLKPFQKNLSLFAIDLDRVMRDRPALLSELLHKIVNDIEAGRFQPLPVQVFPIADMQEAFRTMQQGKHIGKIVLCMNDQPSSILRREDEPITFRNDGTYLITGGLGGFGLAVARRLVERGARHLVLMGRRGGTPSQIAELEKKGATVAVIAGDVAKEEDVAAVLKTIDRTMPPLRGVFHAAMVLEDRLLLDLDDDWMRRVLAPKMNGAWNLHRQTLDRPLDHFVLFSSLSSVFGHAGQGNYAAANAFLDSLAHYRRANGLPGLTVNWGYVGDVGYLAQRKNLGERLERQGVQSFRVRQALDLLETALKKQLVQVSVMRVDWSKWRGLGVTSRISPRFAHLCRQAGTGADPSNPVPGTTLERILAIDPPARQSRLQTMLGDKLARILGAPPDRLDPDKPLLNLGLDSLMAVELRNWIEAELGLNLPIVEVMRSPGLSPFAEFLLQKVSQGSSVKPTIGNQQPRVRDDQGLSLGTRRHHEPFPLSQGQRGLWFLQQLDPAGTAYHVRLAVRILSKLDLTAYRKALQAVMERHPSLRTTFEERNGELVQCVHENPQFPFEVVDASSWTEEELRNRIENQNVVFDLERGPLLQLTLYRHAAADQVVSLTVHHIIGDLWSLVLILEEMRKRYQPPKAEAFALGRNSSFALQAPRNANDYRDFVRWQRELLAGPEGEKLWSYWKEHLAGVPQVLDLPADRPRPARFEHRGSSVPIHLGADLTSRLKSLAAQDQVTIYTVLLTAFQTVLFRTTGQDDFLVGSPFSGRSRPDFENVVGYFINMLPVRADLAGDPSFRTLLHRVGNTVLGALQHQDYPFALLVERLGVRRDPSRTPLVQVTFTLEKPHRPVAEASRFSIPTANRNGDDFMHVEPFPIPQWTCQCDLELVLEEGEDTIAGLLIYNTDLLDQETSQRIVRHFQTTLENALSEPDKPISKLNWMPEAERRQVVVGFNQTRGEDASGLCLHQLFERQAQRTPTATALSFRRHSLSYAELNGWSNRLAQQFRRWNAGPGTLLALCLERSPEMIAGILAVLKAGAAYVPLDPSGPPERLRHVLDETRAPLLLTQSHLQERLTSLEAKIVCIDGDLADRSSNGKLPCQAGPGDLAYVIYTSGSAGRPKGVMIEHRAICNTVLWRQKAMPLREGDRVLFALPYVFDASVCTIFTTLTAGAGLVLAEPGEERDPDRFVDQMARDEVTVLQATPGMLQLLLGANHESAWRKVRWVCSGGETMPPQLPHQLFAQMQGDFFNLYGPTEAAVEATCWQVRPGDHRPVIPIGRPIDNVQVVILDRSGQPAPIGVPGEIMIGGAGLARGYLNDPELTALRFLSLSDYGAHLADCSSPRLYRTGDRGRWLSDGSLEFLGRLDQQVKVRGYRIELGEIEAALSSHPSVQEAVALVHGSTVDEQRLVAYVSPSLPKSPKISEVLRGYLREKLPEYMVPSVFVVMASLPRTSSGKVDRFVLPPPLWERPETSQPYVPPSTPLEKLLAQLWQELLHLKKVGVLDNFFDLGGNSLQAAILIKRLQEKLGRPVSTVALFDSPTIRGLADYLNDSPQTSEVSKISEVSTNGTIKSKSTKELVVCLQPHGDRLPLFMVHPPGGMVTCYQALASRLGRERPFYGIRARSFQNGPASLEDMAAEYARAIRKVQPRGPYYLGGWSLGGVAALEIAQQFLEEDEEIGLLAFLDTCVPSGPDADSSGQEYGLDLSLEELGRLGPDEQLPYLWQHVQKLGLVEEETPEELVAQILTDLKKQFHSHVQLAMDYRIRHFSGRISLFRPAAAPVRLKNGTSPDRGWGKLASTVEVYFVPGLHHTMVKEPHVRVLAQKLQSCLARNNSRKRKSGIRSE